MARNNIHQFVAKMMTAMRDDEPYHTRETIQAAADELRRKMKAEEHDLGDMLIGAIERMDLPEPLDDLEMDEEQRQRNREVW